MSEEAKPDCFIIMPISTPPELLERYGGHRDHFEQVLNHIIEPAVEAGGYNAVRPIAQGSDMILPEIIKNLGEKEMVLCDMSALNPNVFFELGIRTALNRPTIYVRDEHVQKIPFDQNTVNNASYSSSLRVPDVESSVETLARHIRTTREKGEQGNALWKYFGVAGNAEAYEPKSGDRADVLVARLEQLLTSKMPARQRLRRIRNGKSTLGVFATDDARRIGEAGDVDVVTLEHMMDAHEISIAELTRALGVGEEDTRRMFDATEDGGHLYVGEETAEALIRLFKLESLRPLSLPVRESRTSFGWTWRPR